MHEYQTRKETGQEFDCKTKKRKGNCKTVDVLIIIFWNVLDKFIVLNNFKIFYINSALLL